LRSAETIAAVRRWRNSLSGSVGLVPTMGYLHEGHLSLVRCARAMNDHVAASIFVNPTQFGPGEDFARYPRDLAHDRLLLAEAGCDLLFVPPTVEMYPPGCETIVEVGSVAAPLEGERRPGHFRGVATVVLKLLSIVCPDRAYFGQKDAQQLVVIRRMVRDLDCQVEIVGCPTVRESDGLAMSSRNSYLNREERAAACVLYRALTVAQECFAAGERSASTLRRKIRDTVERESLAKIDYVSVADSQTLRELESVKHTALISLAVRVGPARLIDNITVGSPPGDPEKPPTPVIF
jgi:pantoate--beta-alanine ligase